MTYTEECTLFLTDEEYNHVMDLIENRTVPTPLLAEFREWFFTRYGVRLYDYFCDNTADGLIRLRAVLFRSSDKGKLKSSLNPDRGVQNEIRNKFAQLAVRYGCHASYQFPADVFVCFETIRDEMAKRTIQLAKQEIKEIKHTDIWRIEVQFENVYIFYYTDEQVNSHMSDGVSDMIKNAAVKAVKRHDRYYMYDKGVKCVFTSKQTLDEKYAGNMFYYFQ